jgi:hypothetical protein
MKHLLLLVFALVLSAQQLSQKAWTTLSATGATSGFAVPGNDVHTVQVVVTNSPATCTVNLDGSLDATHWFDLSGNQTCTSNLMFHVINRAVAYVRGNVTVLSGAGATVTVSYLGHSSGGRQ